MVVMGQRVGLLSWATVAVLAVSLLGLVLVDADEHQARRRGPAAAAQAAAAIQAAATATPTPPTLEGLSPSQGDNHSKAEASAPQARGLSARSDATPSRPGITAYSPCTDPDTTDLDVGCLLPEGTVGQLLRQVCSYTWLAGLCESTALPDPGYATATDPNPTTPLALRVGAVHNHSGYSDGDPTTIPRDYFNAARTGHNTADKGGDTGVKLDFMWGSDHSDNEQMPVTTAEVCLDRGPRADVSAHHRYRPLLEVARRTAPGPRSHRRDVRRHSWLRVDERLLQPHERVLLHQLRQRQGRRQLRVDGLLVELAAQASRARRRGRRPAHVQPPGRRPASHAVRRRHAGEHAARDNSPAAAIGTTSPTCPTSTLV